MWWVNLECLVHGRNVVACWTVALAGGGCHGVLVVIELELCSGRHDVGKCDQV